MHKGTIEITNKGLGFKLINSISFGESVFPAGFNQKTAKEDLFVKRNHGNTPQELHGKTLEDSKRLSTGAGHETLPGGAGWSPPRPPSPWWGLLVSSFQKVPPPPPRVASPPFLKSV
jgi:hypothetical protein